MRTFLVKLHDAPADAVARLREALPANAAVDVCEALASPLRYVYVRTADNVGDALRRACPHDDVARLDVVTDLAGASAGVAAPFHYVVETDVTSDAEADFNAWYETEHMPGLAAVPGTVRAMRFVRDGAGPRHHACYDLATQETFGSPPWLAVRGTDWSSRVRPQFRNTLRTMFRRCV
jgi:hypothetical protein